LPSRMLDVTSRVIEFIIFCTYPLLWFISYLRFSTVHSVCALCSLILANTVFELVITSYPCLSSPFLVCTMCAFTFSLILSLTSLLNLVEIINVFSLSLFKASTLLIDSEFQISI
jgi:hypothetical protein